MGVATPKLSENDQLPEAEQQESKAKMIPFDQLKTQEQQDKTKESEAQQSDQKEAEEIKNNLNKDPYQEFLEQNQEKLTDRLQELLNNYRNSSREDDVSKIKEEYETTIKYCIEKGKSTPENVMFYILTGVIDGVIDAEHLITFAEHADTLPILEYLFQDDNPQANYEKIKKIVRKNFTKSYTKAKINKDFKKFFWSTIVNDSNVQKKTDETVAKNLWDHDSMCTIAATGNTQTIRQLMIREDKNTEEGQEDTGIENTYAGIVMKLEEGRKNALSRKNKKITAQDIARFLMADGILNGTAYRGNENYTRFDEDIKNAVPRMAQSTNHPNAMIADLREMIWKAITPFDKFLFTKLKDYNETDFPVIKKHLKKYGFKKEINSIDDVYNNLEKICEKVLGVGKMTLFDLKGSGFVKRIDREVKKAA